MALSRGCRTTLMKAGLTVETPAKIVRFLRDCYEADNRESTIFNLHHEKIEHLHWLSQGGEFLAGGLDVVPVDRQSAVAAQKAADLYRMEKTLVFCAFLLAGKARKAVTPMPDAVFAPLIFFPASVEDAEPHAFLRVELREQRVNAKVLACLLGEGESVAAYLDEILARIPQAPFEPHRIQELIALFQEFLPTVDAQELVQFPQPVTDAAIAEATDSARQKPGLLRCLPAYAMALVPNSPDTRGVLTELGHIASAERWSAPLRILTGRVPVARPTRTQQFNVRAPASLNSAQQKALRSAAAHPLTLIIGPPGTGKSYAAATLAVEHLLRGKSVLIASRTNQALDVLADKIAALVGDSGFVLRGGRSGHTKQLKDSLQALLRGLPIGPPAETADAATVSGLQRQVRAQANGIARLERALQRRAGWEVHWGAQTTAGRSASLLVRCWRRACLRLSSWRIARQPAYWALMDNYQQRLQDHHQTIARYVRLSVQRQVHDTLDRHRQDLLLLARALSARTDQRQEEWFAKCDLAVVLRAFPLWMGTLAELNQLLPLKPDLFDLAVVDEATQCDMASCLPVFFRARRVAITGDPRQLRHLSFLSRERQRLLARKWDLSEAELETFDYRGKSVLGLVNERIGSQQQVVFLDEHYRSRPQIIAFSNREFYQNALKIMTQRPATVRQPALVFRCLQGQRDPAGPNRAEATQLVAEVVRCVESERGLPPSLAHSLGVLSPFREQVDYIFSLLSKQLDLEAIKKHRVRIGTAHSFQGEERDVMFVSFVVDPASHPGTLRFLDRPDVFNVSITRARNLQYIFCSVQPADLPMESLLRRYLQEVSGVGAPAALAPPPDAFLQEAQSALAGLGFKPWPCYLVAGLPIDLLVERPPTALGIDLIGYPGQLAKAFDLEKYRMLHRAGLRLFPLPYSAWRKDRQACLEAIQNWMLPPAAAPDAPPAPVNATANRV